MSQVALKVKKREVGKKAVKEVRKSGLVAGNYYLKGSDSIAISAVPVELRPVIYTNETKIIDLTIEGEPETLECVLKDVDFDPVTEAVVHFDLIGIVRGQLMTFEVPIILNGTAIGVREGGILQRAILKVKVSCMPRHLPTGIELDISELKIGDSLTLGDGDVENVEFEMPLDTTVVAVVPPRVVTDDIETEEEELEEGEEGAEEETEE